MKKICALLISATLLLSFVPHPAYGAESQSGNVAGAVLGALVGAAIGGAIGLAIISHQRSNAEKKNKKEIEEEKQKLQGKKQSLSVFVLYAEGGIGPVLIYRF